MYAAVPFAYVRPRVLYSVQLWVFSSSSYGFLFKFVTSQRNAWVVNIILLLMFVFASSMWHPCGIHVASMCQQRKGCTQHPAWVENVLAMAQTRHMGGSGLPTVLRLHSGAKVPVLPLPPPVP
eukprot:6380746-Pyramimonas_sp.AAC.2